MKTDIPVSAHHFQPQLFSPELEVPISAPALDVENSLRQLLQEDLTFTRDPKIHPVHKLHAFAAKFPPQLPKLFIQRLTQPNELVLDPMVGSGTLLIEGILLSREVIGTDLDPLSSLISMVKSVPRDLAKCSFYGFDVLDSAKARFRSKSVNNIEQDYSPEAINFFRYWFNETHISELYCLASAIQTVEDTLVRAFLKVVFSSCIITKSGELTRARDLAHSRPHRDLNKKITGNAFDVFEKRLNTALSLTRDLCAAPGRATVIRADARLLPLPDNSVHLIFTSPPYAANAIDYMRGHKFSLMWLGYEPHRLTTLRREYIGAEVKAKSLEFASDTANQVLAAMLKKSANRASIVANYYREMEFAMREMFRVLVRGRAAALVVGTSVIQGIDIRAPKALAELAGSIGFDVVGVATRQILRDARMMPVSHGSTKNGIEARMHEEGVIGLVKPT